MLLDELLHHPLSVRNVFEADQESGFSVPLRFYGAYFDDNDLAGRFREVDFIAIVTVGAVSKRLSKERFSLLAENFPGGVICIHNRMLLIENKDSPGVILDNMLKSVFA